MSVLTNFYQKALELKARTAVFLLVAVGLFTYQNAIFHPFVHDDIAFIVNNPNIKQFDFATVFSRPTFSNLDGVLINTYYRPLLEVVYRVLYFIFGLNAAGYHLVNILLHITNGIFVYLICRRLPLLSGLGALMVAMLFLVHPVQTEAVACIAGISNTLYVFFGSITFLLYVQIYDQEKRRSFLYLMSLISFALALLAKEQAIVVPVLMVLYEVCFQSKPDLSRRHRWLTITGYGFIVVLYFGFRHLMLGNALHLGIVFDHEFWLRLLSIPRTLVMYFSLMIYPHGLHYYRSVDILGANGAGMMAFAGIFVLVLIIFLKMDRHYRPALWFGLGWFIITLSLLLNIVPLINEFSLIMTAEHFLYWPLVGFLILAVVCLQWVIKRYVSTVYYPSLTGACVGLVLLLSILSINQNKVWASEVTVFRRMVFYQPDFGRGRLLLASALYKEGQLKEGIVHYQAAGRIMQSYIDRSVGDKVRWVYRNYLLEAYLGLIEGYEKMENYPAARHYYELAIKLQPGSATVYNSYAINLLKTGEIAQAAQQWQSALTLEPQNLQIMNALAICYLELKQPQKAQPLLAYIVEKDPNSVSAKENLNRVTAMLQPDVK